jgi:hypothetical protein
MWYKQLSLTDIVILLIGVWLSGLFFAYSAVLGILFGLGVAIVFFWKDRREIWQEAREFAFDVGLVTVLIVASAADLTVMAWQKRWFVHFLFACGVAAASGLGCWLLVMAYWIFSPEGTPPGLILEYSRHYLLWVLVMLPLLLLRLTPTIKKSEFWKNL